MSDYGAANKYDFDNPQKWVTREAVPLLDEHEMTDEAGRPMARVDKAILEQIAQNNNRRVMETGDPATLILGHTSDDPRSEEKPAKGFTVNYRVLPFKRDPATGQVIYAIHGDFKLRPQNAHLLEEYPRRSVELWWNKKELDPIALLGGTSPERDLGVVIRKARLKHLALLGSSIPERDLGQTIRFSRHGNQTIESYEISPPQEKVRRSRTGDAMPKPNGKGQGSPKGYPRERVNYEHDRNTDYKFEYADESMDTDDLGDYDPGDEDLQPEDAGTDDVTDPTVAKVFQSKQWKELSSKLDRILGAIESAEPGTEPGMPGDEMPPPGTGGGMPPQGGFDQPGGDAGMDAPGGDYPDELEPEEEDRRSHGGRPVKMNSTGYPGLGNVNIPDFNTVPTPDKRGKPFHRRKEGTPVPQNPELVRMQKRIEIQEKKNKELLLKYAMSEANQIVSGLVGEGILFGDTPEESAAAQQETTEYLAHLGMQSEKDRDYEVEVIRKRYRRRPANPANPVYPGVARYARAAVNGAEEDPEDFEPQSPQEGSDLADMVALKKMSRADAVKAVKKLRAAGRYPAFDVSHPTG
jgi:hypothetical protein